MQLGIDKVLNRVCDSVYGVNFIVCYDDLLRHFKMVVGYILNVVYVLGMPKGDLFLVFEDGLLVTSIGVRTVQSLVLFCLEI